MTTGKSALANIVFLIVIFGLIHKLPFPVSELSYEIHFALNMPNIARLLARRRRNIFFKNCQAFFAFCDVILVISNISVDSSM